MLSSDQQQLVTDNLDVANKAVAHIKWKLPHLAEVLRACDLESAAYEGMCRAARTFDRNRSDNVAGYMFWAARNAAIRELEKELRTHYHRTNRIDLEKVEIHYEVHDGSRAIECLQDMEEMERDWLEHYVMYGKHGKMRKEHKIGVEKVRSMLNEMMEKFREMYQDYPDD